MSSGTLKIHGLGFLLFLAAFSGLFPQSRGTGPSSGERVFLPGGHRGAVTALIYDESGRILSAGEDGFLEIWDPQEQAALERFQLSPYGISSMALRPGKPQVAVVESDGLGLYRVSAWDYEAGRHLFTLRFRDPLSFVKYSAGGNFLIAAKNGGTGLAFLRPETGEALESPQSLTGTIDFAATGKSERTMITYFSSGVLSYWDLSSEAEIRHFEVPPGISSPVLIGNNRFFAGFDSRGFVVLNASSGAVLLRNDSLAKGTIFTGDDAAVEFVCLVSGASSSTLYHLEITNTGTLRTKNRKVLPASFPQINAGVLTADAAILGSETGAVIRYNPNGGYRALGVSGRMDLVNAAASGTDLAFFAEGGVFGVIDADYQNISAGSVIRLEKEGPYTNMEPLPPDEDGRSRFLLWQSATTRSYPLIRTVERTAGLSYRLNDAFIDRVSQRFPLRSVSVLENKILFLDTVGNISILDGAASPPRGFTSSGSLDGTFIDGDHIILGKSAVPAGNTPFLIINTATGETVPLPYPAFVGNQVYRGGSGKIYGAAITRQEKDVKTSIIAIDTANPARSTPLIEYAGEDTLFSIAESGESLASTIGGGPASLYRNGEILPMERSPGLPRIIIGGGNFFIVLDTDGNIVWQDNQKGTILALLQLHERNWRLERNGEILEGRVVPPPR
ncbi:MAG: WD40 repeat domain-containing protein [Treponema sp.]|jgi:WD40 repeat protein|nr:WD40 repeat domain-containing protein [Treponema sp.]